MKKIIILMPVYNDWESLAKVLDEIDSNIQNINDYIFNCIVINDCSTIEKIKLKKPKNFNSLKIINMRKNMGHARCNATGLRYINSNEQYDYVIIMDSDGEDRPTEIKYLINKIRENPINSVVAKRVKRSEGIIFRCLYQLHKIMTYLFTGKKINFGNYSCLVKEDVKVLVDKKSLWSSFSGTLRRNIETLNEINSTRGFRYFGPSKMSLLNLALHSLAIIAVFKNIVFLRSTIIILLISFFIKNLGINILILQILLIFFCLLIFLVSLRENNKELSSSEKNILNIEKLTH